MGILAAVLAGVCVVGGVVWAARRADSARAEALHAAAMRLGWVYRAEVSFATLPDLDRFELFGQGRSRRLTNLLTSPSGRVRAVVFDYTYETGGGKSRQTHRQTVYYATADDLALPRFSLRPQHFLHGIGKIFGYQDIDLEHRPTFSEMFVLRGDDEAAVRAALTDGAVEYLEQRRGVCVSGVGRELLFWRAGRRIGSEELESFIAEGSALVGLFCPRS